MRSSVVLCCDLCEFFDALFDEYFSSETVRVVDKQFYFETVRAALIFRLGLFRIDGFDHRSIRRIVRDVLEGTTVFSVKLNVYFMFKSVARETLKSNSYDFFLQMVLFVFELFLISFIVIDPCEKMTSLVDISKIKLDGIGRLLTVRFACNGLFINRYSRRHGFIVFGVMFLTAVIRALKPDVKEVIRCVGFYSIECNCIRSFFRFKGLKYICLTPNRHYAVLSVGNIKGNNYIVLFDVTSHLNGINVNIANHRSKWRLECAVQYAIFSIVCPDMVCVVLAVSKQAFYFEFYIVIFHLCISVGNERIYFCSAIYARVELGTFLIGVGEV